MSEDFEPSTPELLGRNATWAEGSFDDQVPGEPRRRLAVIACMDSRLDVTAVLGLAAGDVHMLRNAGGIVTDDVIRSLCLSQRYLNTREVILIHHTDCGLQKVDEAEFRAELLADLGVQPPWSVETFDDPFDDVRQSMRRLQLSPFVEHTDHIRGFVYDVTDGRLYEVL